MTTSATILDRPIEVKNSDLKHPPSQAETVSYRHVPFVRVGVIELSYSAPKPLVPRRIIFEDLDE